MARASSKKQEQLTFPELELLPEALTAAAGSTDAAESFPRSTALPEPISGTPTGDAEPGADLPRPSRKRTARARVELVRVAAVEPELPAPAAIDQVDAGLLAAAAGAAACGESVAVERASATEPGQKAAAELPGEGGGADERPAVASPALPAVPPPVETATQAATGTIPAGWRTHLKTGAHVSTLLASLVVVGAVLAGLQQFAETQRAQREAIVARQALLVREGEVRAVESNARAADLFIKYNDLVQQLNAMPARNARRDGRYWKEGLAVGLLESLFNLTRGDRDWEASIAWSLDRHARFVREQRLPCATYSDEFVRFVEKSLAIRRAALCRDGATPG